MTSCKELKAHYYYYHWWSLCYGEEKGAILITAFLTAWNGYFIIWKIRFYLEKKLKKLWVIKKTVEKSNYFQIKKKY